MSKVASYAPGTPCWVDLSCADIDASVSFYADLLGWQFEEPGGEETGGYRRARFEGEDVAALMPAMRSDWPQMWNTYISVADATATATKVTAAGGKVIEQPMQVMDLGKAAVFGDPAGAVFCAWEPGTFAGAGRVNGPGAL